MTLQLNPLFSDGAVLQQGKPLTVWGTAEPMSIVEASIQEQNASCTADSNGNWRCAFAPLAASEAEELTVSCKDERIVVRELAVGEVFIAGGQSNMEFWMRYEQHLGEVRPNCLNPRIRFFDVPKLSYPGQLDDFDFSQVQIWRRATPEELERFSAVGYYFARELEATLNVPIGIVGCNYGGTRSVAWMSPEHAAQVQPEEAAAFERELCGLPYEELLAHGGANPKNDKGYATWPAWEEFFLPGTPSEDEIEAFMASEEAQEAGAADVGGLDVGGGTPAALDHPGLMAPSKHAPGALFTYMTSRIAGFAARGVLWYQGESDDELAGAQARYRTALETIIADWRAAWNDPDLPFFLVQLPGFGSWLGFGTNDWTTIRNCQQEVADSDDEVWLCSISDAGDEFDIHPKDKQPVGHRLALLARRYLYGEDILADAPRLESVTREGKLVTLRFANAGEGLCVRGDGVNDLEVVCGEERIPYSASVSGNVLNLRLDADSSGPFDLQYAQSGWFRANLYNSAGIPALPFRVTVG